MDSYKHQFLFCAKGLAEWHKEMLRRAEAYQKSVDVVVKLLVSEREKASQTSKEPGSTSETTEDEQKLLAQAEEIRAQAKSWHDIVAKKRTHVVRNPRSGI